MTQVEGEKVKKLCPQFDCRRVQTIYVEPIRDDRIWRRRKDSALWRKLVSFERIENQVKTVVVNREWFRDTNLGF